MFIWMFWLGCGGPTQPLPAGSANYSGALGSDPDFDPPGSLFRSRLFVEYLEADLSGTFADGPPLSFHTEAARSGSCRLLTYTAASCDPGCGPSEACIEGTCVPYPVRSARGSVTWTFPGGEQTVDPDGTQTYYASSSTSEDGPMTLTIEGALLETPLAPLLTPDGDWERVLADRSTGADATLSWTNPMEGARVRLRMTDCTGSHGGFADAEIECEAPDVGSLTVPGAYLDALDAGDWDRGDCGSHVFHRYHAAALEDDSDVRFEVRSPDNLFYRPE